MADIDDETTFDIEDGVVVEEIEGEAVLLDLEGDTYYSLNHVAHFIWDEIESGASLGDVVEGITAGFEVEEERARKDAVDFLEHAVEEGLAEPQDD